MSTAKKVALVTWKADSNCEHELTPPEIHKLADGRTVHAYDVLLAEKLKDIGVEATLEHWSSTTTDWSSFDMVLLRTPWDYQHHLPEFLAWADSVGPKLVNSASVLRWNTDKSYLLDLAAAGVPVVPSVLVSAENLEKFLIERETGQDCILKPAVGASALGVTRFTTGTEEGTAELKKGVETWGRILVQPFQPSVKSPGELSVVFQDAQPQQGVVKVPAETSIFVHEHLGGSSKPTEITEDMTAFFGVLTKAMNTIPAVKDAMPLLYMRVDMLLDAAGKPQLSELEIVEPSLYWHVGGEEVAKNKAASYAAAILKRL